MGEVGRGLGLRLRQNEGHRGKTARALGIDPKTLYNKLGPERTRKKD
jgi:DNA-binding NtrC family response regulator